MVGETQVRGHCTFQWREVLSAPGSPRIYEIDDDHCEQCIAELKRISAAIVDKRTCAQ